MAKATQTEVKAEAAKVASNPAAFISLGPTLKTRVAIRQQMQKLYPSIGEDGRNKTALTAAANAVVSNNGNII